MTAGQACDPGLTASTPTIEHNGRSNSHSSAGPMIATAAASRASCPGPAGRAVPELGHEVGEGDHHERQRRVVVVLERGAVDARPRDPLGREPDRDEGQRQAAALERHAMPTNASAGMPEPPDDEAAGVVEGGRRPAARPSW